jgi:BTB/POZ domain
LERVSSKLLEPIASNPLEVVSFIGNTKINCYFRPGNKGGTKNLQELVKVIVKRCGKPDGEEKEIGGDVYKQEDFDRECVAGFKDLWGTKNFTDFIVIVGLKEFAVHKGVLSTHSCVFTEIFLNGMKEKPTGKMEIEDFSANVVERMLKFMYTGEVQDEKLSKDLFAIAAKYEVKSLKIVAGDQICMNVNESNALEVFGLGHLHNSDALKRRGFTVILQMFPKEDVKDSLMEKLSKRSKKLKQSWRQN